MPTEITKNFYASIRVCKHFYNLFYNTDFLENTKNKISWLFKKYVQLSWKTTYCSTGESVTIDVRLTNNSMVGIHAGKENLNLNRLRLYCKNS